jgi:hypothetical protein
MVFGLIRPVSNRPQFHVDLGLNRAVFIGFAQLCGARANNTAMTTRAFQIIVLDIGQPCSWGTGTG